jgi:hypothetical protein
MNNSPAIDVHFGLIILLSARLKSDQENVVHYSGICAVVADWQQVAGPQFFDLKIIIARTDYISCN